MAHFHSKSKVNAVAVGRGCLELHVQVESLHLLFQQLEKILQKHTQCTHSQQDYKNMHRKSHVIMNQINNE